MTVHTVGHTSAEGVHSEATVYSTQDGLDWTGEELQHLDEILLVFLLHANCYRLTSKIKKSAMTQYLTGLPNSGGFMQFAGRHYAQGTLSNYDSYFFNLKGTRLMNIQYGQSEGDEVLRRYAHILTDWATEDECIGHLGGDNFVALIKKSRSEEFCSMILDGIRTYAERGGIRHSVIVPATVGVMRIDEHLEGPWMIISGPSIALQYAKREGQPFVELTKELIDESNRERMVESAFHSAINNGEFVPYYQPKVDMATGKIIGAEVLARWIQNGQPVPSYQFIPVLERTGEITELDLYMLEHACLDMQTYRAEGRVPVPVSVNISRRDLEQPDLAERIRSCLDRHEISRDDILIEVTETANENEGESMMRFLNALKDANIRTSIDDFGTGFSSLSFLRDYPTNEIKIDRSFINHPELREKDRVIIGNIINMASQLGIEVITEGVETKEQEKFLLELGCRRAQGFLYDKPLSKKEFLSRLTTNEEAG